MSLKHCFSDDVEYTSVKNAKVKFIYIQLPNIKFIGNQSRTQNSPKNFKKIKKWSQGYEMTITTTKKKLKSE